MTDIVQTVQNAVLRQGVFAKAQNFVLLCSGGRDSVCLLDIFANAIDSSRVSVLHLNYGLRAQASEDERFVIDICRDFDYECIVKRVQRSPQTSGNLQAWARQERYRHAQSIAYERSAVIVTGHTATDQLETFLYRLCVSPGRRALTAMSFQNGNILRPLLNVTRDQITEYCKARHLSWCEDLTNRDETYLRNRIRKRLLPVLEEIHPLAHQNILRTVDLIQEEASVLDALVDETIAGRTQIPVDEIQQLPLALRRLVVRRLAEDVTGRLSPRVIHRLDDLFALQQGKLDLGEGARAVVTKGNLSFQTTPEISRHTKRNA